MIKFRILTHVKLSSRYDDPLDVLEEGDPILEDSEFGGVVAFEDYETGRFTVGEVNIPGHGWHACLIKDDRPQYFYDSDDGWQRAPDADYELA